jgi:hypothetical protein
MKKTYITPALEMDEMQVSQMIAQSDSLDFGDKIGSADGAESRYRSNLWDDDEDELDW